MKTKYTQEIKVGTLIIMEEQLVLTLLHYGYELYEARQMAIEMVEFFKEKDQARDKTRDKNLNNSLVPGIKENL